MKAVLHKYVKLVVVYKIVVIKLFPIWSVDWGGFEPHSRADDTFTEYLRYHPDSQPTLHARNGMEEKG